MRIPLVSSILKNPGYIKTVYVVLIIVSVILAMAFPAMAEENLTVDLSADAPQVAPERKITYRIHFQNLGDKPAINVRIRLEMQTPKLARFVACSDGGVFTDGRISMVQWDELGDLAPGERGTVFATWVTYADTADLSLYLRAAIFCDNSDIWVQDTIITPILHYAANITINPDKIRTGPCDIITYRIRVANTGKTDLKEISLTCTLPEYTTFVDQNMVDLCVYQWSAGSFRAGEMKEILLKVRVHKDIPAGTTPLYAQTRLVSTTPFLEVITDAPPVYVTRKYVSLLLLADRIRLCRGESVTYTVRVFNTSTGSDLRSVRLQCRLPRGFQYVPGTSWMNGSVASDPDISESAWEWPLGSLMAEQWVDLRFRVKIAPFTPCIPVACRGIVLAEDDRGGTLESSPADLTQQVCPNALGMGGTITGKVFWDLNGDGVQNQDEPGIPGVVLVMEDGLMVSTDPNGKFSIPGLSPGDHLLGIVRGLFPVPGDMPREMVRWVDLPGWGIVNVDFGIKKI